MITIANTYGAMEFSSAMRDLAVSITYTRAVITLTVTKSGTSKVVYSETLYPDSSGNITLSDIDCLLEPYAEKWLVFTAAFSVTEQQVTVDADGNEQVTPTDSDGFSLQIVSCKANIVNETATHFCNNHFLTLFDGIRQTAHGYLEYLTYTGTDTASCAATYGDGSTQTFQLTRIGGSDEYSVIDVSPSEFDVTGKTLVSYRVSAGLRYQDYQVMIDADRDVSPVLLFMNSFGVEELAYCTGEHRRVASFDRKQTRIGRLKTSYEIQEKESFKADTGPLTYPMANWWREVLRSKDIKVLQVYQGEVSPLSGVPVIITSEKAEVSNEADFIPRYTFDYEYSDRNHSYYESRVEGRIFDNTFDNTFN
ncbi:MAG: hypothetical protein K5683_02780 [Prevotella sp.]|nr:hypothetical protein [Prevotella sp.]